MFASANPANPFATNLAFPLVALSLFAVIAVFAFLPLRAARIRRHPKVSLVTALALLWALLTAGSVALYAVTQTRWQSEQSLRLSSGYLDPAAPQPDAPAAPVPLWVLLALAYPPLLTYAYAHQRRPPFE
jgi:hypothetical protein